MANITVTVPQSNITVNETTSTVNVATTTANVTVGETAIVTNAIIRAAISATSPVEYNSTTGVIGIDSAALFTGKTTDDLQEGSTNLYYTNARVVSKVASLTSNVTTTANVSGAYILGDGSQLTGMGDHLTNAQVKTYIEAQGLSATANLTTSANVSADSVIGVYLHGDGSNISDVNLSNLTSNISTTANISTTGNIIAPNIYATSSGSFANGNIYAGNVRVVAGNLALTNGGYLSITGTGNAFVEGGVATGQQGNVDTGNLNLNGPIIDMDGLSSGNTYVLFNEGQGAGVTRPLIEWNNTAAQSFTFGLGRRDIDSKSSGGFSWYSTNNTLQANTIETTGNVNSGPLYVTGDSTIVGNLQVNGNIDYVNVEDLLVTDNTITLNYGNAAARDAFIYVDRSGAGGGTNAHIKWNETSDGWEFYNATDTVAISSLLQNVVEDTTPQLGGDLDLNGKTIQAGNANAALAAIEFGSGFGLGTGGRLYGDTTEIAIDSGADINLLAQSNIDIQFGSQGLASENFKLRHATATVFEAGQGAGIDLKLGSTNALQIDGTALTLNGALDYANATVVGTLSSNANITTTANVSGAYILGDGSQLTNIPHPADAVTSVNTQTGVVVLDTADIAEDTNLYYTDARVQTKVANLTGDVTTTANVSGANVNTDHIISASGQPLQLKGQTDGIELDKTIDTVESRIFDTNTTGYSVADLDFHTAAIVSDNTPAMYTTQGVTLGSPTATAYSMAAAPAALYAIQEVQGGGYTGYGAYNQPSLQAAVGALGANTKGFITFQLGGSTTSLFPAGTYVVSIVGNTITYSQNAIASYTGGAILLPGAFSTTQNLGFSVLRDNTSAGVPFKGVVPWTNPYVSGQTLANVTLDAVSYGDATVSMANVVMRHIADVETGPDSAIRVPRAILVGANATPDLLSVGTTGTSPATSTLGITVEQDGLTDFGDVDTTPQLKVLLNNFTTNSLASYTTYPLWSENLGQSGNATVDMPYLGASNFNFKLIGGTKEAKTAATAGEIPGRITFNAITGASASGSDPFNPPASITAMVGGAGALTTMANSDMYFQSTSATSYRNGPYLGASQGSPAGGSIPQTFLASKSGTTVLAANQAGVISLRPVRDYADPSSASTFVDNRYADNLHEYHSFLDVGYDNPIGRTGSLVTIQPKSGQTNGATPSGSDFNYDSKGDSVLRLKTHNADSTLKSSWDIEATQSTGKLSILDTADVASPATILTIDGTRTAFSQRVKLQNLDTTAINALASPEAGDTVFNTTLSLVCVYNGSAWRKLTDDTM